MLTPSCTRSGTSYLYQCQRKPGSRGTDPHRIDTRSTTKGFSGSRPTTITLNFAVPDATPKKISLPPHPSIPCTSRSTAARTSKLPEDKFYRPCFVPKTRQESPVLPRNCRQQKQCPHQQTAILIPPKLLQRWEVPGIDFLIVDIKKSRPPGTRYNSILTRSKLLVMIMIVVATAARIPPWQQQEEITVLRFLVGERTSLIYVASSPEVPGRKT